MPVPASTAERLADLTSLGFVLREIEERFIIRCAECKRVLHSARYGDLQFINNVGVEDEMNPLRVFRHNIENDRTWLQCRLHKAWHSLSLTDGTSVPRGARGTQSLIDTITGIHDLYVSLRAGSSGQRDVLVKELAFFLRGVGYGDAADAL